jgi:cell division protein FtsB
MKPIGALLRPLAGRIHFRLLYIPILMVMGWYAVIFTQTVIHDRQLAASVSAIHQRFAQERADNQRLRRQIEAAKTPRFVFNHARAQGYVRSGEQPVIVRVTYQKPMPKPHRGHLVTHHSPPWEQWWNAFFGITTLGSR